MANEENKRLVVDVMARVDKLEKGMAKAAGTVSQRSAQMEVRTKKFSETMESNISGAVLRANGALSKLGVVGVLGGAAIAGVASVAKSVAAVGDAARIAGLKVKAFQELKFVASQNRVDIDSLTDGLKELQLRADEFIVTGKGSAAEAFQRLGYSAAELKEKLKEPDQLFLDIIGKLGKLNKAAQIRVADELFGGTGGEKFVKLIAQGEKGLRDQIKAANDLGAVMSDELVAKAEEVDRQFNLIADTIGTRLKSAIVESVAVWSDFIDSYNDFKDQRKPTLEKRQAELGLKRVDIENQMLAIGKNEPMTTRKLEVQLAEIAAEEKMIVEELNKRVKAVPAVVNPGVEQGVSTLAPITVTGGGGTNPYATAKRLDGATEDRDSDVLKAFFKQANSNVDPKMTAWCAAFVNAALAANGMPGTGSNAARSFMNYGEATNDPRQGDLVVLKRGGAGQGHVGFYEGTDPNGNVRVFGGNQSDGVNTKSFKRENVLGFRTIPGADRGSIEDTLGASLDARADAAEKIKERADAYKDLIDKAKAFVADQGIEVQALGMTATAAAKLKYEQNLLNEARSAGLTLSPTELDSLKSLAAGMADAEEKTRKLTESQREAREAAEDFAANAGGIAKGFITDLVKGTSAADALKNALSRIADQMLEGALNTLFGGGNVKGGGFFGQLFSSAFKLPGNAKGTDSWSGGPTWVGEKGPEIINAPRGAQIIPNHQIRKVKPPVAPTLGRRGAASAAAPAGPTQLIVNVNGASGDMHIRELSRQGAQEAIAADREAQRRGNFGAMQRSYQNQKG